MNKGKIDFDWRGDVYFNCDTHAIVGEVVARPNGLWDAIPTDKAYVGGYMDRESAKRAIEKHIAFIATVECFR